MTIWRKVLRVDVVVTQYFYLTLAMIKFVAYSPSGKILFSAVFCRNFSRGLAPLIEPQSAWNVRLDLHVLWRRSKYQWAGECTNMRIAPAICMVSAHAASTRCICSSVRQFMIRSIGLQIHTCLTFFYIDRLNIALFIDLAYENSDFLYMY